MSFKIIPKLFMKALSFPMLQSPGRGFLLLHQLTLHGFSISFQRLTLVVKHRNLRLIASVNNLRKECSAAALVQALLQDGIPAQPPVLFYVSRNWLYLVPWLFSPIPFISQVLRAHYCLNSSTHLVGEGIWSLDLCGPPASAVSKCLTA